MTRSERERHGVLRVAGVVVGLSLAIPLYYGLVGLVPGVGGLVPPVVAHAVTGIGVFLAFPGMVVYARRLDGRSPEAEPDDAIEYGVNDRWERQNL